MDSSTPLDEKMGQGTLENAKPDTEQYSVAMVDTIFADTLSRGMQNAITSQQNAQMASSTSITNACARILQARATTPITAPINTGNKGTVPTAQTSNLAITAKESLQGEFNLSPTHTQAEHPTTSPETKSDQVDVQTSCCPHSVAGKVAQKNRHIKLALYWTAGMLSLGILASSLYIALV